MTTKEFNQIYHRDDNVDYFWLVKRGNKKYILHEWWDHQHDEIWGWTAQCRDVGIFTSPIAADRFIKRQGKQSASGDSKASF